MVQGSLGVLRCLLKSRLFEHNESRNVEINLIYGLVCEKIMVQVVVNCKNCEAHIF